MSVWSRRDLTPSETTKFGPFVDEQFERIWGEAKSIKSIRMNLGVIYQYIPRNTLLVNITDLRIDDMVTKMKRDGMANGTINRKLDNISKSLKRAKKLRLITQLPEIERLKEGAGRDRR
ncbi:hypothetical protein [Chelativorans sp. Marseille-P2723]|uniref:hypothetical protein n=1 Tax=Chelativorans sp. Marseille-P2723 TaxID=2709133 RepID=UPI00156EDD27|nr:hypothetical protein [Chelativorans sp. Marseille-P2723]